MQPNVLQIKKLGWEKIDQYHCVVMVEQKSGWVQTEKANLEKGGKDPSEIRLGSSRGRKSQ